jgi:hypothetical protein
MSSTLQFFQSTPVVALLIAIFIFATTIFLAVKRWIGFSLTVLFLLFSLAAGLMINHQQMAHYYLGSFPPSHSLTNEETQDAFHAQILQALEDLKLEVKTEKENLRLLMNQVQEIFDSMDVQKRKLQNFIEETRERFKTEYPTQSSISSDADSKTESEKETSPATETSSPTPLKELKLA